MVPGGHLSSEIQSDYEGFSRAGSGAQIPTLLQLKKLNFILGHFTS